MPLQDLHTHIICEASRIKLAGQLVVSLRRPAYGLYTIAAMLRLRTAAWHRLEAAGKITAVAHHNVCIPIDSHPRPT